MQPRPVKKTAAIVSSLPRVGAILCGLCLLTTTLQAEESHPLQETSNRLLSQPVVREKSDGSGGMIRIAVSAPEGKQVDPRLFELLSIERQGLSSDAAIKSSAVSPPSFTERLDVSGYYISVTARTVESTCSTGYVIKWNTGVTLSPNQSLTISISGSPEQLQATTYPQGGDVNLYLYAGSSLLASSTQPSNNLDTAGVVNTSCQNDSTPYKVVIANPSASSTARFVGVISQVFIQ